MCYKIKLLIMIFLLSGVALFMSGCPGPAEKPEGKMGKEPTISLYVVDMGETKENKMEEYLQGVIAAEMDTDWPKEALGAQAIVARTFTLKKIEEGGAEKRGTDASTSHEEFQAYDAEKINDAVRQAVKETRGEVIRYQQKNINAWFHADAGGRTAATPEEGGLEAKEETPYIKSVDDPGFEITTPENKSWTVQFPLEEIRRVVQEAVGMDPGNFTSAEIVEKGPSGRALKIKIGDAEVSGASLRLGLGAEKMRSTLIEELKVEGGSLVIKGKGFGHGVGMSQWGARAMAENGKSAEEIVKYFFKNIEINKAW